MYDPNQSGLQPDQQGNQQPINPYPPTPPVYAYIQPMTPPGQGAATAGFVLCLISLCCCMPLSIPGLICSIVALAKGNRSGMAIAGLIIGIVSLLLFVFLVFTMILSAESGSNDWYYEYFGDYYNYYNS